MNSFKYFACFAGIALAVIAIALVATSPAHAAKPRTHHLAPPVHCTMANRMDVFIDEDNIMWECICEPLSTGFSCHWQVIGGVDAVTLRKHHKRHLKPKRIIAYTIPAVVA